MGFGDEVWWGRLAQPNLQTWTLGQPLRLLEKQADRADPKAIACYGLLLPDTEQMLLRFVEGRPVSAVTCEFLSWAVTRLAKLGKRALVLFWDNASWHKSQIVRDWVKAHNKKVKREGGCRLLTCLLPVKSPWLNPIEPKWMHGKTAIAEPTRTLSASELIERICAYYRCEHEEHIAQKVC